MHIGGGSRSPIDRKAFAGFPNNRSPSTPPTTRRGLLQSDESTLPLLCSKVVAQHACLMSEHTNLVCTKKRVRLGRKIRPTDTLRKAQRQTKEP